jgi:hypothetical protein
MFFDLTTAWFSYSFIEGSKSETEAYLSLGTGDEFTD